MFVGDEYFISLIKMSAIRRAVIMMIMKIVVVVVVVFVGVLMLIAVIIITGDVIFIYSSLYKDIYPETYT